MQNIKNNFAELYNGKVKECEMCGRLIEKQGRRTKYCKDCWSQKQKQLWRDNKRKQRKK